MTELRSSLRLHALIGRGHFGEVWIGEDDVHGQVAVKIPVGLDGESDDDWIARREGLLSEAQRLSRAQQRNVVAVHKLGRTEDGESLQMCMEF